MWKDPIVEEIRSIREGQAEALDFDIRKIIDDAKAKQRTSGHPLASFAKGKRPPHARRKAARPQLLVMIVGTETRPILRRTRDR